MRRSDWIRRAVRLNRGQSAPEYLGVLAFVAVVTGAVVATGIGGDVSGYAHHHVCRIVNMADGGGGCDSGEQPAVDEPVKPATASGDRPGEPGEPAGDPTGEKQVTFRR